jgi:hypothetical protein
MKDLKNVTPKEAWSKNKPDVSHFHVFGNVAWDHIPNEKMKALQPKSEKHVFVEYSKDVKGYRFLQPHFNEIMMKISRPTRLIQCLCHLQPVSHLLFSTFLLVILFWICYRTVCRKGLSSLESRLKLA